MELVGGFVGRMISLLVPFLRSPTLYFRDGRIGGESLPHDEVLRLRDAPLWCIDFEIVSDPPIVAVGVDINWRLPGSRSQEILVPLNRRTIALHAPYRIRPFDVPWMLVPDADGVFVDGPGVVVIAVRVRHRRLWWTVSDRWLVTIRLVRVGPEHGRIVVEEGDTSGPDDEPRNARARDPDSPLHEV